jgi:hypothetical protein
VSVLSLLAGVETANVSGVSGAGGGDELGVGIPRSRRGSRRPALNALQAAESRCHTGSSPPIGVHPFRATGHVVPTP